MHDFSEMIYTSMKPQKLLFSIVTKVTRYVAVLKITFFFVKMALIFEPLGKAPKIRWLKIQG